MTAFYGEGWAKRWECSVPLRRCRESKAKHFGHALHSLLSRWRYRSQSGTAVRRDFVEFPSQIFEHWMSAPETLRRYARHYQTGQSIPEDLLRRLLAARTFNQGFATVAYTGSALLDLDLHREPSPQTLDLAQVEGEFLDRIGMPKEVGLRHRPAHFQQLLAGGGYAAGYYAYLWAEVLDADGYATFTETGNVFDPELAARLKAIYSAGDTTDPMELYRAFRSRDPKIDALLNSAAWQRANRPNAVARLVRIRRETPHEAVLARRA